MTETTCTKFHHKLRYTVNEQTDDAAIWNSIIRTQFWLFTFQSYHWVTFQRPSVPTKYGVQIWVPTYVNYLLHSLQNESLEIMSYFAEVKYACSDNWIWINLNTVRTTYGYKDTLYLNGLATHLILVNEQIRTFKQIFSTFSLSTTFITCSKYLFIITRDGRVLHSALKIKHGHFLISDILVTFTKHQKIHAIEVWFN